MPAEAPVLAVCYVTVSRTTLLLHPLLPTAPSVHGSQTVVKSQNPIVAPTPFPVGAEIFIRAGRS